MCHSEPRPLRGLDLPPVGQIDGVDLVTEGMLTVTRALAYLEKALGGRRDRARWYDRADGASLLARALLDEATDVNFLVGRAVNPANGSAADLKPRRRGRWPTASKKWASGSRSATLMGRKERRGLSSGAVGSPSGGGKFLKAYSGCGVSAESGRAAQSGEASQRRVLR